MRNHAREQGGAERTPFEAPRFFAPFDTRPALHHFPRPVRPTRVKAFSRPPARLKPALSASEDNFA